ncbi:hypothetical protein HDF18_04225 [Mucilaginibacter sp. X5P1]|uniref:hypothetical protein n=1 Tax=Mucilaginibacter sp. X5P1 TaxID=2723088 RepID=UPI00161720BC|nr:hypothetical protein [Mucilaginibacter sp. X5P1]MBB6136823.1 hypothetical protein [Mucilaginibacter sp. X5P1]
MNSRVYQVLLLMLVVASFFHSQAAVLGLTFLVIVISLYNYSASVKMVRLFTILLIPPILGLIVGYENDTYLILKDFYYFSFPLIFLLCGILLASQLEIADFLKTIVLAGVTASIIVTVISIAYTGFSALTNPYSAHYAMGILGTPAPAVALACLLFTKKFNIRLFTSFWFNILLAINVMGIYMFASRSYFIILMCFLFLLIANRIKWSWITPLVVTLIIFFTLLPTDIFTAKSSDTFLGKLLSSFNEISIGNYNTEQDINIRYRGYESFMALDGYMKSDTKGIIFGGLGKLVDLKTFVRLGVDTDYRYIPVLHNGWLYILVKTGATGVLTYLVIFFGLITVNWKKYADAKSKPIIRLFAALTIGCILSLMLTNYIITSFFNVEMSIIMITLGYSYMNFYSLLSRLKEREEAEQLKQDYINNLSYSL